MNKFSKFITTSVVALVIMPLISANIYAQQTFNFRIPNPTRYDSLEEIISAIASLIRPVFLITFGAMILYGAFLLLTSRGDEGKVESSKKTIGAAIVGFAIAALAPTIVNIVLSFLGVDRL